MTEISFITQNGEQINLKDAKGRELLAEKQTKLKAGSGISISEDGTISAVGGAGITKGEIVIRDLPLSNWCGENYTYDLTIEYVGNPGIIVADKKQDIFPIFKNGSMGKIYPEDCFERIGKALAINYDKENAEFGETIFDAIASKVASGELVNSGEHFCFIRFKEAVITDAANEQVENADSHFYYKNQKIVNEQIDYSAAMCSTNCKNTPILLGSQGKHYEGLFYFEVDEYSHYIGIDVDDIEEVFWTK